MVGGARGGAAYRGVRVLILCPGSDLAGVGIGIKRAFDKHSDWDVRQVRRVPWRYDYPHDAEWKDRQALIDWADVVHVMEEPRAIPAGKRAVLHHHGSYARTNRHALRQVRATHICSTLDLELLGLGQWVPAPYDIDWLATLRKSGPLTVAHAGTWAEGKSTAAFLAACEGLPINVLHITGKTWAECLRLKGTADIYFDQVLTGYGNNAVEAWGMGIPVIAGIEPAEATRRGHLIPPGTPDEMESRFGGLPFLRATEHTIHDALEQFLDPDERAKWSQRGMAHVRRFHDQEVVVRQLEDIYRRAVS
jgi:hypothetical protein